MLCQQQGPEPHNGLRKETVQSIHKRLFLITLCLQFYLFIVHTPLDSFYLPSLYHLLAHFSGAQDSGCLALCLHLKEAGRGGYTVVFQCVHYRITVSMKTILILNRITILRFCPSVDLNPSINLSKIHSTIKWHHLVSFGEQVAAMLRFKFALTYAIKISLGPLRLVHSLP